MARTDGRSYQEIIDAIQAGDIGAISVGHGSVTIATAGVPEQLSVVSIPCTRVWVQANKANAGIVSVGGATVVAGNDGHVLFPTQGAWFEVSNLNLLYVDSTSSADGVTYFYEAD